MHITFEYTTVTCGNLLIFLRGNMYADARVLAQLRRIQPILGRGARLRAHQLNFQKTKISGEKSPERGLVKIFFNLRRFGGPQ